MSKRFLTDKRRSQAIQYAQEYRKRFDPAAECSEVPINNITGIVEKGTLAKMSDCTVDGVVKLGAGSSMISCYVPKGITVEVGCGCFLCGVSFDHSTMYSSKDKSNAIVRIMDFCFILYSVVHPVDIVIGQSANIITGKLQGDMVIGKNALIWDSKIAAECCEIKDDAVITGTSLYLVKCSIGDRFTASSYTDIVTPTDQTRWVLPDNAANLGTTGYSSAFELSSCSKCTCGSDFSIFGPGTVNIADEGILGDGVTILNADMTGSTQSNVTCVQLRNLYAKANSTMLLSKRTTVYANRINLSHLDLSLGTNSAVVCTGLMSRIWSSYNGKVTVKDNSTVSL